MVPQIVFSVYGKTRVGLAYFDNSKQQELLAVQDFKGCDWVFNPKESGWVLDKPGLYLIGIDLHRHSILPVAGKDMKFIKAKLNSMCRGRKPFNTPCIASASLHTLIQKFLDVHGSAANSTYTPHVPS